MIKIISYTTDSDKQPFTEWLETIDCTDRQIIATRIIRLRLGNFGNCKPLKGAAGVYELVMDHGPGYRVYYGKEGLYLVILLIGGTKRGQNRDIEKKAKRYWTAYQEEEK